MSKELDRIIEACEKRMNFLNAQYELQGSIREDNQRLWKEAFDRFCAATNAKLQQQDMHWTTSGDFSHLQSTGAVSFR